MVSPRFLHLRVHSEYSLLEGAIRLNSLPGLCTRMGMSAVAITDTNAMFGAQEFSAIASAAGLQPIIGCQIDMHLPPAPSDTQKAPRAPLVLLVQNAAGYANLMKLNSCLYLNETYETPQITTADLAAHAEGLICLTGGAEGPLGHLLLHGAQGAAKALLEQLVGIYGDRLYLELQRHKSAGDLPPRERQTEYSLVEMAYALEVPLVATNDAYFVDAGMYPAHDALLCVAQGVYVDQQEPRRRLTEEHYFKSQEAMVELFADLPEAVANTVEIARRCAFMAPRRETILPTLNQNDAAQLQHLAQEGLQARLEVIPLAAPAEHYQERLHYELDVIGKMGFAGYFLVVADFIRFARENDIPVGPGRGSGAGSLVAYALAITDLDPVRYGLLFERFLNPERVSMPDFDIDFCVERREEVIAYVQSKYGQDRVGQIITFGALLSRAAVRDIGRVLQISYGEVDRLAKMIPARGMKPLSIEEALKEEPRLRAAAQDSEVTQRLLTCAQQIEGLLRNASTHAAGVVIADRALDTLVPLYRDTKSSMPVTQFSMEWAEKAGLIKYDFLGLKNLTVMRAAVELIKASGRALHIAADGARLYDPPLGMENDISALPLDDPKTYDLYARAQTIAVFQVESSGMMDVLRRMKPTCFEDIIALVALYRPGPMDNIPSYCDTKNGHQPIQSIHPLIDPILGETQGIIVYQEQVMQIAQIMAGYSLGEADVLRRAMGKKIKAEMDAERPRFEQRAVQKGVKVRKAREVFSLLEKFANFGFNKSHAAAYALVSIKRRGLRPTTPQSS